MRAPHEHTAPTIRDRVFACIVTSGCFLLVYNIANRLAAMRSHIGVAVFSWEEKIPFIPQMIFPYWSLDLFFVAAPFFCHSKAQLRALVLRLCSAICVAGLFFVLFPLRLLFHRPEVNGVAGFLFGTLDTMRDFYNLAPSLHIAIRSTLLALYLPLTRGLGRPALKIWFFLIGISTLLCWRHHVIDIFTGQLLALMLIQIFPEAPTECGINRKENINADVRIGACYLFGSFLFVTLAAQFPPQTLFLFWPASALAIVALAYLGFGPGLFGKRAGRFDSWTTALLYPYQLGARLSARIQGQALPQYVEITPQIWIGQRLHDAEAALLVEKGAQAVLDLTAELPENNRFLQTHYKNIPVLDLTAPSVKQLEEAVAFLLEQESKGPVYVHCILGRSRSAVVAAAYLLASSRADSVKEAVEQIKTIHPHAVLRKRYIGVLEKYDRERKSARR